MRLKKLTLKNWGPHESLEMDMDTPVYGLIGPNGSGKTNILQGIEFVFTGFLDRPQETYVRRTDGDSSPKNGSVEAIFIKDGNEGTVFRQVGATPKRHLIWEGKKYTKVAEIDEVLNGVLDCDRRAVSMAVFLSQGKIGDFLFSTPAERERLFATICLVDHLPKVGEVIDQRLIDLRQMTHDQTASRDEALAVVDQAKGALHLLEVELKELKDHSGTIAWIREAMSRGENLRALRAGLQQQQALVLGLAETAGKILKPGFLPDGDTSSWVEEQLATLKAQEGVHSRIRELESQLALRKQVEEDIRKMVAEESEILALLPEVAVANARVETASAKLAAAQVRKGKQASRDNLLRNVASSSEHLATLEAKDKEFAEALPKVEAGEAELAELRLSLPLKKLKVEMLDKLGGAVAGECCPLCQGKDLGGLQSDLANLPALREEVQAGYDRITRLSERIAAWRVNHNQNTGSLEIIRTNLAALKESLVAAEAELEAAGPEMDGAALEEEMKSARARQSELTGRTAGMDALMARRREYQQRAAALPPAADTEANLVAARADVTDVSGLPAKVDEARRWVAAVSRANQDLENARAVQDNHLKGVGTAAEELQAHFKAKPKDILRADEDTPLEPVLEDFSARQRERDEKRGGIEAATANLRRAETRLGEIDARIAKQGRIMNTIGMLEQLKDAFSRTGIQRHYLAKVFEALLEGTQQNLASWDGDFQVEKDPDKPFNFLFFRSDDPGTLLDQSQLSGGQRVRLSISFLLAVQQLVIPELNFMVLDEPSTHLDLEGVEGLGKLFRSMGEHLDNSEAQVIVVDHHLALSRSFSKFTDLATGAAEEE